MAHSVDMLHIRDYNSMQRLRKHQTIYLRTTGLSILYGVVNLSALIKPRSTSAFED